MTIPELGELATILLAAFDGERGCCVRTKLWRAFERLVGRLSDGAAIRMLPAMVNIVVAPARRDGGPTPAGRSQGVHLCLEEIRLLLPFVQELAAAFNRRAAPIPGSVPPGFCQSGLVQDLFAHPLPGNSPFFPVAQRTT